MKLREIELGLLTDFVNWFGMRQVGVGIEVVKL